MIKSYIETATQNDADRLAMRIVSTLGTNYQDFDHACRHYNSVFFKNMPPVFTRALCTALSVHFEDCGKNPFWEKWKI